MNDKPDEKFEVKNRDYEILDRIIKTFERENPNLHLFTEEEVRSLKRVAAREHAWASLGILASSFKTIITYLGFIIVSYLAVKGHLVEWIINITRE